jgi:hypothetical protein
MLARMSGRTAPAPCVPPDDEVILEFLPHGTAVRVSALHVPTLTEVVIQGPAAAGEIALTRAALDKLAWVLARRRG